MLHHRDNYNTISHFLRIHTPVKTGRGEKNKTTPQGDCCWYLSEVWGVVIWGLSLGYKGAGDVV